LRLGFDQGPTCSISARWQPFDQIGRPRARRRRCWALVLDGLFLRLGFGPGRVSWACFTGPPPYVFFFPFSGYFSALFKWWLY
jgi:hypothetical protein